MSKKIIIISAISILILVIFGGFFWFKQEKPVSPLPEAGKVSAPSEEKGELLLYEDEAGFSFQYPQSLGIVEKDVSDQSVYSSLELLSKNHPEEKMVIKITDTNFATVEQWLGKNPQEGKLFTENKVSLSGMKGKSLKYEDPSRNLVLVIDSNILYYLESPSEPKFWEQAFNLVAFSFKLLEAQAASSWTGASVIEEEEEIIE